MNKILSLLIIISFSFLNLYPVFADENPSLTKDEQIEYKINAFDGIFFHENKKIYNYIIKKYTIHNNTEYDFEIVNTTELYNEDDYKTLLSLKPRAFEVSDSSFLWTMCSLYFPPFLAGAIPSLLIDAAKTPYRAIKNKNKGNKKRTTNKILREL